MKLTANENLDNRNPIPAQDVKPGCETTAESEALPLFAKGAQLGSLKVKTHIRAGSLRGEEDKKKTAN
jgi:hypothetical protein